MPRDKLDPLQERFRQAIEEAPLYSLLGQWLTEHREEFEALLHEGQPDWAKIAETFGAAGLRDEAMRRPTAESAERAWNMVQERHGRRGARG
jgi:hypothetical protein